MVQEFKGEFKCFLLCGARGVTDLQSDLPIPFSNREDLGFYKSKVEFNVEHVEFFHGEEHFLEKTQWEILKSESFNYKLQDFYICIELFRQIRVNGLAHCHEFVFTVVPKL